MDEVTKWLLHDSLRLGAIEVTYRKGNPVKIDFHHGDKLIEKLISRLIISLISKESYEEVVKYLDGIDGIVKELKEGNVVSYTLTGL